MSHHKTPHPGWSKGYKYQQGIMNQRGDGQTTEQITQTDLLGKVLVMRALELSRWSWIIHEHPLVKISIYITVFPASSSA